jgi:hypothetical protein
VTWLSFWSFRKLFSLTILCLKCHSLELSLTQKNLSIDFRVRSYFCMRYPVSKRFLRIPGFTFTTGIIVGHHIWWAGKPSVGACTVGEEFVSHHFACEIFKWPLTTYSWWVTSTTPRISKLRRCLRRTQVSDRNSNNTSKDGLKSIIG